MKRNMPNFYILFQDAFNRSKRLSDGSTFVPIGENYKRVFTAEQENAIEEYAIKIARMFYGLHTREFRKVVLKYAEALGSENIPEIWKLEGMATRDWYYAYMTRHPKLALKAPEGMSIARAMAFNRTSIEIFFKAYTDAVARHNFRPDRIFNLDESGLSTVMKPTKVVCERGRPVATQVARERGAHMSFVGIVSAAGHFIPPVFIVARKRMNPDFLRGTIDGSSVILHHNAWMTHEGFVETLQHVRDRTYCSVDNKILLIMDNAECHMSIHAVEFAIRHGIILVTLPPHTTAKLQPLDVGIFGPFKTALRILQDDFKLQNPHVPITEHILPEMASKAWITACTPKNVMSGFAATGIWPINRNIFPDEAFAGAEVSEQPDPHMAEGDVDSSDAVGVQSVDPVLMSPSTSGPSSSDDPQEPGPSGIGNETLAPASQHSPPPDAPPAPSPQVAQYVPYPKAAPRTGKKRKTVVIAANLSENQECIDQLREKEAKRLKKLEAKRVREEKKKLAEAKRLTQESKKRKAPAKKKKVVPSDTSSEEDQQQPQCDDSSEYSEEEIEIAEGDETTYPFQIKEAQVRNISKIARIFTFIKVFISFQDFKI